MFELEEISVNPNSAPNVFENGASREGDCRLDGQHTSALPSAEFLNAALRYTSLGWPVFPVRETKRPYTKHGYLDATTDGTIVRSWWARWPSALVSIATGEGARVVAVDVDVRREYSGFETLRELGLPIPITPKAHTPSGGIHLLFQWPGFVVRSGTLGHGLEIKGDKGSLIMPPGPGRMWDVQFGLGQVELAVLPERFVLRPEPPRKRPPDHVRTHKIKGSSARFLVDDAISKILCAREGSQERTLNDQAFRLGACVAEGVLPREIALEALLSAGLQMRSYDPGRPWKPNEIEAKVRRAFEDGFKNNIRLAR